MTILVSAQGLLICAVGPVRDRVVLACMLSVLCAGDSFLTPEQKQKLQSEGGVLAELKSLGA